MIEKEQIIWPLVARNRDDKLINFVPLIRAPELGPLRWSRHHAVCFRIFGQSRFIIVLTRVASSNLDVEISSVPANYARDVTGKPHESLTAFWKSTEWCMNYVPDSRWNHFSAIVHAANCVTATLKMGRTRGSAAGLEFISFTRILLIPASSCSSVAVWRIISRNARFRQLRQQTSTFVAQKRQDKENENLGGYATRDEFSSFILSAESSPGWVAWSLR